MLLCRLCGINLQNRELKNIFEDSTDLKQKIIDTLPINISPLDGGSKFVCISCHDKVILYHKFIQEVLKYERGLNSEESNCFHEYTRNEKEQTDIFANICSDTICTCPNCNVDLMILLVGNPQNDYSFQISLAIVGHTEKIYPTKEQDLQNFEKPIALNIKQDNVNPQNCIKLKANMNGESMEIKNIDCKNTLAYDMTGKENSLNQTQKDVKRKFKKNITNEETSNSVKIPKVEVIYEPYPELVNYKDTNTSVELESTYNNIVWSNCKDDCNSMTDKRHERIINNEDIKTKDKDNIKSCPRIICNLCGARYLSQLKYEFHMERHKFDCMDKYVCVVCRKEASNENLLWDHYYYTHKNSQRFVCLECDKLFSKYARIKGHQKKYKHSGIQEINVDIGNNEIDNDTKKELAVKIQGKTFTSCNLCGKLIFNLDPDAINDLVTCSSCEDSTLSLVVDGNKAKVISPRQYHCSKCSKHFVRKERLEFHEMRHNENMKEFICKKHWKHDKNVLLPQVFTCPICMEEFPTYRMLKYHMIETHEISNQDPILIEQKPWYECEECHKTFKHQMSLKAHKERIHEECPECGEKCNDQQEIRIHLNNHLGEKLKQLQNI
ncbi:zinc finger protein 567-like isoform X1 [Vespula maculifrons]|uniref:Zinc finger protein 567-like isoform X1 n=1 Tax=Vespula maculifrons TaxID=7453 RepID=A0ABD2CI03_VESMC